MCKSDPTQMGVHTRADGRDGSSVFPSGKLGKAVSSPFQNIAVPAKSPHVLEKQIKRSTREQAELAFRCQLFLASGRGGEDVSLRPTLHLLLSFFFSFFIFLLFFFSQ